MDDNGGPRGSHLIWKGFLVKHRLNAGARGWVSAFIFLINIHRTLSTGYFTSQRNRLRSIKSNLFSMCKNDVSFFQAAFQESRDALHTSKAAFQENRDALHTSKAAFQESRGALQTSKAASWSLFSTAEHDPQPSKRGGKWLPLRLLALNLELCPGVSHLSPSGELVGGLNRGFAAFCGQLWTFIKDSLRERKSPRWNTLRPKR